ncbi:hypothetical protein BXY80_1593 [Ichthyenterobacterium magnum]|uniref:Uncharacterized protein n=1 Tax=Ichthyenterobacterium magnum TaxID=1230530 RepID=A0A420DM88_9FLAO|nr:hypothetical protein BXY80_1593 [Ichthyenterobacterium magnum]
MILTITLIISFLIVVNFLLLIFSCNKSTRKSTNQTPQIVKKKQPKVVTNQLASSQLAPTGS